MKRTLTAVLTAALTLTTGADAQLLPFGEFQGRSGRPGDGLTWKVNDAQGQHLAQLLNARHADGRAQFNFDYDHQTMLAPMNGQKALASGWASRFEWRAGQGLYALNVRWTPTAQTEIREEQYKYLSPVIKFDEETGVVTDVLHASLTNFPDLMQMSAVTDAVAALNAQLSLTHQEHDLTLLAQMQTALGLPAATTEAALLTAVTALKTKADAAGKLPTALSAALGLTGEATEAAALSAVTTLKAKPAALPAAVATALGVAADAAEAVALSAVTALKAKQGDDGATQVIRDLQTQVAALSATNLDRDITGLVDKALQDGKLLPAQKEWATKMGKTDIAQLSAYIATAPVVAKGLGTAQVTGQQLQQQVRDGLTQDELAMCSALGLTPAEFKAAAPAAV
jgi:phage I-like protein